MKNKGIKYWLVLLSCCGLSASSVGIVMNTIGVFYTPVSSSLGVSQGTFTLHATFCILATAFTVLIVPRIMKKIPLKLMVLIGVSLTSLATFAMGLSHHVVLFYILGIIRGIGAAMYGVIPVTIVINNWIYKQNGLATSIALCFSGFAGALLSPIFSSLIESVGWEYTYFIVAIISFVLVLPFLLLPFKEKPEDENKLPYMMDESLVNQIQFEDEKVRFNSFQLKFILFFIIGILLNAITGMGSHFPTYALSIGFDATLGSLMLSATMVGNIGFKFVIGVLSDKFGIIKAVYMMIIINIISLSMFIFLKNEIALLIASFLFGSIYSITAVGIAIMTRKFFGELNYSSAYANIQFGCNFGVAFAVSLIGFIYDFTASYSLIFLIAIIIGVLTIILINAIQKMKTV